MPALTGLLQLSSNLSAMALSDMAETRRHGTQQSTAQHSTAQHSTAQHSTAQHSTAQHSTATDILCIGLQWLRCKHLPVVLIPHNRHSTLQGLCCCQALYQTQLRCFTTGHRSSSQGIQAVPQICHEIPSVLTLLRHLHCTVNPNGYLLTVMAGKHVLQIVMFAAVKHVT